MLCCARRVAFVSSPSHPHSQTSANGFLLNYFQQSEGNPMARGMPTAAVSGERNESGQEVLMVLPPVYEPPSSCNRDEEASKEKVTVLHWGDFWASTLTYLEINGNTQNLTEFWTIPEDKKSIGTQICDASVLNLRSPLPESVDEDLLRAEGESLRSLLTTHLPAPFSNGWRDCNQWVVSNMN